LEFAPDNVEIWSGIEDDVIDNDLILVWGEEKRIITGSDILGRLLRGISINEI
jgi:metal transporter CNNM